MGKIVLTVYPFPLGTSRSNKDLSQPELTQNSDSASIIDVIMARCLTHLICIMGIE